MIEDKTIVEMQKIFQNLLDKLAEEYDVPTIPVKVVKKVDGVDGVAGMFFSDEYRIEMGIYTDALSLLHEFVHYLIKLTGISAHLDEFLTQWAVTGIRVDMSDEKDPSKIKTIVDGANKQIKGLQG